MLTLFTIPKAFVGHVGVIQRNAITSWTMLRPGCEIILFGDDGGTAEIARELGLRHVPEIARNELGTPLVSDMFQKAQDIATYELCCFVNSDIILMVDFVEAARRLASWKESFLMVGRPWDIRVDERLDFTPTWSERLRMQVMKEGRLRPPAAIDYFLFRGGFWGEIPPFAIGRPGYDNWLLYRARSQGIAVVDASRAVVAVHQNHSYDRFPNGVAQRRKSPESKRNLELAGGSPHIFTLMDATHILTAKGPKRARDLHHLWRRLAALPMLYPRLGLPFRLLVMAGNLSRPARIRLGLTLAEKRSHTGS